MIDEARAAAEARAATAEVLSLLALLVPKYKYCRARNEMPQIVEVLDSKT